MVSSKAEAKPEPTVEPSQTAQRRTNVSQLYDTTCAKCHGQAAEGGGGGTPSLLNVDKFHQKWDKPFFDAIKKGVPDMGMEAYGETLTDAEIWGLVVHIRELQAQGLRTQLRKPANESAVNARKEHNFRIETVVGTNQGLRTPWGIDWLPDGRMLVTNRPGTMMLFDKSGKGVEVANMPPNVEIGQGGLMDVAVHPDYAKNGWIYLAVNDPSSAGRGGMTKIVRGKLSFSGGTPSWTSQQDLFTNKPEDYNSSGVHFGSRIVFDGKGHIFFSIGERGAMDRAQDLGRPNGKIFRIKEDGGIPADNPFVKDAEAIPQVWSYGHRNPQGLVMDLQGNLWDTEHGPRGGDELNKIEKGRNYGWPLVAFSINYNDSPFRTPWPAPGQNIAMPTFRWLPSIGASGLDVVRGPGFAKWKGDILAGGLSGQNVDRIRVRNGQFVEREEILGGMGRVRDVVYGPDGAIYVALNGPDKIVRLVEAK